MGCIAGTVLDVMQRVQIAHTARHVAQSARFALSERRTLFVIRFVVMHVTVHETQITWCA